MNSTLLMKPSEELLAMLLWARKWLLRLEQNIYKGTCVLPNESGLRQLSLFWGLDVILNQLKVTLNRIMTIVAKEGTLLSVEHSLYESHRLSIWFVKRYGWELQCETSQTNICQRLSDIAGAFKELLKFWESHCNETGRQSKCAGCCRTPLFLPSASIDLFIDRVIVYIGPPGCGKSRGAAELCGRESTYYKPRGKWWDGYWRHDNVIIDDFYGWLRLDEMLRILDRYPHRVQVKGGYVQFLAKRIVITSNLAINEWYKTQGVLIEALLRRIDTIKIFKG